VLAKYGKLSGMSPQEAKLNYLDHVQQWTFYGCTFWTVEQRQWKEYPPLVHLGINGEGVVLMHPEKRSVLENYQFQDIVTWGHSEEKFIVVVGNVVQQRKLIFKTSDGRAMNALIHDYVNFRVKCEQKATAPAGGQRDSAILAAAPLPSAPPSSPSRGSQMGLAPPPPVPSFGAAGFDEDAGFAPPPAPGDDEDFPPPP